VARGERIETGEGQHVISHLREKNKRRIFKMEEYRGRKLEVL